MLFLTTEHPSSEFFKHTRRDELFKRGIREPAAGLFAAVRTAPGENREMPLDEFWDEVIKLNPDHLLLFIHGYMKTPEDDIFTMTEILQEICYNESNDRILVLPLMWRGELRLLNVNDYVKTREAADGAGEYFSQVISSLIDLRKEQEDMKIHMLAHSMGNRVLGSTLKSCVENCGPPPPHIFENTFLVAADVSPESIESGGRLELAPKMSDKVVVYYADDDLTLAASWLRNLSEANRGARLGREGPRLKHAPDNVYAIDCSQVNQDYGGKLGHTYFLNRKYNEFKQKLSDVEAGEVARHIVQTMVDGKVPVDTRRLLIEEE